MTYYDFAVKKNIYKDLKTYYENYKRFVNCATLLDKYYNKESDIYDIEHDCIEEFLRIDLNDECESFEEFCDLIDQIKTKAPRHVKKQIRTDFVCKKNNFFCLPQNNAASKKYLY